MADRRLPMERVITVEDARGAYRAGKVWDPVAIDFVDPAPTVPLAVTDGIVVVVDGEAVAGPATVKVPESEARGLVAHGWATEVTGRKPR